MWNFAKSLFSFSWAMSFFGIHQMANLFTPSKAAKALDDVSRAARAHLGNPLKTVVDNPRPMRGDFADRIPGSFSGWEREQVKPRGSNVPDVSFQGGDDASRPTSPQPLPAELPGTSAPNPGGGWGPMPADSATPETPPSPQKSQSSFAEPNISPDYPYQPQYLEVFGSRMHYIEQGSGDPILLLHGNPTWSYIWRNIIPHLSSLGRCIAPDLIGYGRSDKPGIEYHWFDHVRYLDKFIEKMRLRNITLVLHDHGSGLGFNYAMRHQNNIKAIAFFEAIVKPYPWDHFSSPNFRDLFKQFRTGGVGGQGWQMLVEQNMFIEQLLPQAAGRNLSEKEMNFYREPFRARESRVPIWRLAGDTPIGGEPQDVWAAVASYSEKLQRSELPKLMLYFDPGALLTAEHVDWCKQNIKNLKSVYVAPGLHFVQESAPHRIGQEIAAWCRALPSSPRS